MVEEDSMNKKFFITVGDRITTKKFGRWTVADVSQDGYIILVKVRAGRVTETFKVREDRVFGL